MTYQDWREIAKTDNRPLAIRSADRTGLRANTFGGHYLDAIDNSAGPVGLLFWGVAQNGRWGVIDHAAFAYAVESGWQPATLRKLRPWLRAGFLHGSGDGDPSDAHHGTFFGVLPTPRPYARLPFFNLMNIDDAFGSLALRPNKAITLRTEAHSLRLASRHDLWYQGGGAFQPWSFGYIGRPSNGNRSLATLFDVTADWQIDAHLNVNAYLGRAIGKSVIGAIYPSSRNSTLGYLELGYRF